jgi:phospholipase/carboxylesterase
MAKTVYLKGCVFFGTRVNYMAELSHIHRFEPATTKRPPLLLLHGTGGNEDDLLPLGRAVAPGAALLSPRGKVLENGMPRFFRRLSEGVFDFADVRQRAGELASFVREARAAYGLVAPIAVGFSNGANIAAAMLMLQEGILSGAVLLRAMVPLDGPAELRADNLPVLMLSGAVDPIIPAANAEALANMLRAQGANVDFRVLPAGHGLSQDDVQITAQWLQALTIEG